jgi:hypothetical protein
MHILISFFLRVSRYCICQCVKTGISNCIVESLQPAPYTFLPSSSLCSLVLSVQISGLHTHVWLFWPLYTTKIILQDIPCLLCCPSSRYTWSIEVRWLPGGFWSPLDPSSFNTCPDFRHIPYLHYYCIVQNAALSPHVFCQNTPTTIWCVVLKCYCAKLHLSRVLLIKQTWIRWSYAYF